MNPSTIAKPKTQLAPLPIPTGEAGLRALRAMIRHRSPLAALEVFHHELGDAFRLNLPGFRPVILVGPEAAQFVLVTERHNLRWRAEGEPVTRLLQHGVLVEDGDRHDELRRWMNPALHRRMLEGYVDTMVEAVDQVSAAWNPTRPQDMLVEMRRIALLILTRTLFRVDFSQEMEQLWPAILRTLAYISPGPWLLWPAMPRPGYRRALQQMDAYLYQIIKARRQSPGETDDLLGLLIATPGMKDDLIRDQLLTMLIAGHDTSTALLAWTLTLLGEHPEIMARVQAEVEAVLGETQPTLVQLNQLVYLEQVIKEALRLYPPIHLSMRIVQADLEFQGYHIPAGSRVLFSIYLTQRHPAYWDDPARFDPDRFTAEQNRQRAHYLYLPFGGGPRNCLGLAFAQVEARAVLARLFQKFLWKKEAGRIHVHMGATLEPRPQVLMRVQPRTHSQ